MYCASVCCGIDSLSTRAVNWWSAQRCDIRSSHVKVRFNAQSITRYSYFSEFLLALCWPRIGLSRSGWCPIYRDGIIYYCWTQLNLVTLLCNIPNAIVVLLNTASRGTNVQGRNPFVNFHNVSFVFWIVSKAGFLLPLEDKKRLLRDFQPWKNAGKMQKVLEKCNVPKLYSSFGVYCTTCQGQTQSVCGRLELSSWRPLEKH